VLKDRAEDGTPQITGERRCGKEAERPALERLERSHGSFDHSFLLQEALAQTGGSSDCRECILLYGHHSEEPEGEGKRL